MCHEAYAGFWEAALKNFPKLPHLTNAKIIYNYRTPKAFNTSCWYHFDSVLSNQDMFPRLEVVDVCPTFRSQFLGHNKAYAVCSALRLLESSGREVKHWGKTCEVFFVPLGVLCSSPRFRNPDWYSYY